MQAHDVIVWTGDVIVWTGDVIVWTGTQPHQLAMSRNLPANTQTIPTHT